MRPAKSHVSKRKIQSVKELTKLMGENRTVLVASIKDIPASLLTNAIIGYEPKWGSRGSGRDDMPPPHPDFISSCIQEMRLFFKKTYCNEIKPFFIYGGRSTPERTKEILADKNINGLILGSACNTVEKTMAIADTMNGICKGKEKILVCNFKAYDLSESYEKYVAELSKLSQEFIVLLAPAYTDIKAAAEALNPTLRQRI